MPRLPADEIRTRIAKKDAEGTIRHGGEWLTIWSDPDSLKSATARQEEARHNAAIRQAEVSLAANIRALSGQTGITVLFQDNQSATPGLSEAAVILPRITELPIPASLRGEADQRALCLAFPRGPLSLTSATQNHIEDQFWQARAAVLGMQRYGGIRHNLLAFYTKQLARAGLTQVVLANEILLRQILVQLAACNLGQDNGFLLNHAGLEMWNRFLLRQLPGLFEEMAGRLHDMAGFAAAARHAAERLLPHWQEAAQSLQQPDDQQPDDQLPELAGGLAESIQQEQPKTASQTAEQDARQHQLPVRPSAGRAYPVFTDEFDRVAGIEDLLSDVQLKKQRAQLDAELGKLGAGTRRLAAQLARLLATRFETSWQFDQAEGLLDVGRLGRVVTNPLQPLSFKTEQLKPALDCTVSLLVDNSGSMRGQPIRQAALAADMIAAILSLAGVEFEVLGFTTSGFRGGNSYKKWVAAGRPANPGRLCDLLQVIYKSADQPFQQARQQIAGLYDPPFLAENIDGEAVLWAARRLLQRPPVRKLLLVLSDGAPADRITLEHNQDSDLLARHLVEAVRQCRKQGIEVSAIGLNYDISHFYPKSLRLDNPESVPELLLESLTGLLAR